MKNYHFVTKVQPQIWNAHFERLSEIRANLWNLRTKPILLT